MDRLSRILTDNALDLAKDMTREGTTLDLSWNGCAVLFSDFSPDYLWCALFYIKHDKLTAIPIEVWHRSLGHHTVVRFPVDSV